MKEFSLLVLIFIFAGVAAAQEKDLPEWLRVLTFDDRSTVELNTDYVMFSTDRTARVRFRWTYTALQSLSRDSRVQYRSILQEIGFDCTNRRFYRYETRWFDPDGKLLQTSAPKKTEDWKTIYSGNIVEKMYPHACRLIDLRKREPAQEVR